MKRRRVIMVATAAIILGLFWLSYTSHREPRYEGRSLSEWLRRHESLAIATTVTDKPADAVRHIGTNALPFLINWIDEFRPMSPRQWSLFTRVSTWEYATPGREFLMELIGGRTLRAKRAMWACQILGETARDATPDLERAAGRGDITSASPAIGVLPYLGNDGLRCLLSVTTNTGFSLPMRFQALGALGQMRDLGTNARPVAVLLIRCLDDPQVAPVVALTLSTLHLESDLSVPALIECTRSTNVDLRITAAISLGRFGRSARGSVPRLTKLLNDSDESLRSAASKALDLIAADSPPR